jgi:hypothetical protein
MLPFPLFCSSIPLSASRVVTVPIGTGGAFLKPFPSAQEQQRTLHPLGIEKRGQYSMENMDIKPLSDGSSARS